MSALRSMAQALSGDVAGASVICPGPRHSPRDRSLSVTLSAAAPDGFIVFSHAGDDWRACRAHVLERLGRPADYQSRGRTAPPSDSSEAARALWQDGADPRGTIVERYLASRGLTLSDDIATRVVRFHGACPWRGEDGALERRPAMVTAFRSIADDRLVAVHRTLLSEDGRKLDRRMLGPVGGAAIKIDGDQDVEYGLTICEGFETGMAGRDLGFRPVWALGSAGAIGSFPLLSGIDALIILAETDDRGANARAVRTCGDRWAAADRDVLVATPRVAGDMNDALRA
jgi:putative DNA primase/helicase